MDTRIADIVATKDKKKKPKPLPKIFKGAKPMPKKKTVKKAPPGFHRMPDGTLMTGSKHTKDSKPVKARPKKRSGY